MPLGAAIACALIICLLVHLTNEIKRDRMLKAKNLCAFEEGEANSPEACGCRSCLASIEEEEGDPEDLAGMNERLEGLAYPAGGERSPEWAAYSIKCWLTVEERRDYTKAIEEADTLECERLEEIAITREVNEEYPQ